MGLSIPPDVSSSQELANLILEVKDYSKWFTNYSIVKKISKKNTPVPPKISGSAIKLIKDYGDNKNLTRAVLNNLVYDLEKSKKQSKLITITLAAPVTSDVKNNLVKWLRDNINSEVLVNFQFNATILGGMILRCGSHIYDWSFRKKILENRQKFPEILQNV